jgi:hypothetical protein
MSPSQGRCLYTGQHKHRKTYRDIHASSGIRTHDPSIRAGEGNSCPRPRHWFNTLRSRNSIFKALIEGADNDEHNSHEVMRMEALENMEMRCVCVDGETDIYL